MRTETQSLHESIILSKTHFYLSTLHLKKLTLGGWKWYHAKRKYRLIWSISLDELKTSMLKNCESRAIKTFFFYIIMTVVSPTTVGTLICLLKITE